MPPKLGLITTWDDLCGIAHHSRHLLPELERYLEVAVIPIDEEVRSQPDVWRRVAARANQCDLVHLQYEWSFFGPGFCPAALARIIPQWLAPGVRSSALNRLLDLIAVPLVTTVHELPPAVGPASSSASPGPRMARLVNRRCLARSLARAAAIITHSTADHATLIGMGISESRIHLIPHGVGRSPVSVDSSAARTELNLTGKFVLLIFGFVNWRKGHRTVIDLLPQLPEDFVLVIAGAAHPSDRSGYYRELQEYVARMGLTERVRFTGALTETGIAQVHSAADVTVAALADMPGGSGSLTTSLGFGVPVVGWGPPQYGEFAARAGGVAVLPRGDVEALRSRLVHLYRQPADLERLRQEATAAGRVGMTDQAANTVELYQAVLGEDLPSGPGGD